MPRVLPLRFDQRRRGFLRVPRTQVPQRALNAALRISAQDTSKLWTTNARTTNVAADGDPVGNADDLSGNNRHLVQTQIAAPDRRPLYKTNQINGKAVLRLDGAASIPQFLKAAPFTLNQPWTIFLVIRPLQYLKHLASMGIVVSILELTDRPSSGS